VDLSHERLKRLLTYKAELVFALDEKVSRLSLLTVEVGSFPPMRYNSADNNK
jgi:hypothetical protein